MRKMCSQSATTELLHFLMELNNISNAKKSGYKNRKHFNMVEHFFQTYMNVALRNGIWIPRHDGFETCYKLKTWQTKNSCCSHQITHDIYSNLALTTWNSDILRVTARHTSISGTCLTVIDARITAWTMWEPVPDWLWGWAFPVCMQQKHWHYSIHIVSRARPLPP